MNRLESHRQVRERGAGYGRYLEGPERTFFFAFTFPYCTRGHI